MTPSFSTRSASRSRFAATTPAALVAAAAFCLVANRPALGAAEADGPGVGWLGMAIDDSLVPGRLVIVEVDADGPAKKAGVKLQDMLLAINGEATVDAERFAAAVTAIAPGDEVRLAIERAGAVEEIRLLAGAEPRDSSAFGGFVPPVAAAEEPAGPFATPAAPAQPPAAPVEPAPPRPLGDGIESSPAPAGFGGPAAGASSPAAGATSPAGKVALGVRTIPVDADVQARYGLPQPAGALVVGVVDDMPASRAGLPSGSVIVALDSRPVRSPVELTKLVSNIPVGRQVRLEYVLPGGEPRAADVSLMAVPSDATPSAGGVGTTPVSDEIRTLRAEIESLSRRLDALERGITPR